MVVDGPGNSSSNVPPPFLTKTYEMVDDPSTDHVVSWSDTNCSFVVWNVADFTKDLLPQYFKHNNFSSFVRQLNTYGFHKIDPERQEFANEGFSKGNKENLKNIHRRKPSTSHNHSSQSQKEHNLISCNDAAHERLLEEVGRLQKEKGVLLAELLKVKQQQEGTEVEMESLGHCLQALEERQQQMMTFLARVLGNQSGFYAKCAQQLQQMESSMTLTFNKRRRLQDKEGVIGVGESWEEDEAGSKQVVLCNSVDAGDAVSSANMVKTETDASSYEQVLRRLAGSTLNHSNETSPMSRTSGVTLWEIPTPVNTDSARSGLPATPCKVTNCEELNRAARPSSLQARALDQSKGTADMQVANNALGSNDVFWENLLTENPRLSDKDVDEPDDFRRNERWFL